MRKECVRVSISLGKDAMRSFTRFDNSLPGKRQSFANNNVGEASLFKPQVSPAELAGSKGGGPETERVRSTDTP